MEQLSNNNELAHQLKLSIPTSAVLTFTNVKKFNHFFTKLVLSNSYDASLIKEGQTIDFEAESALLLAQEALLRHSDTETFFLVHPITKKKMYYRSYLNGKRFSNNYTDDDCTDDEDLEDPYHVPFLMQYANKTPFFDQEEEEEEKEEKEKEEEEEEKEKEEEEEQNPGVNRKKRKREVEECEAEKFPKRPKPKQEEENEETYQQLSFYIY